MRTKANWLLKQFVDLVFPVSCIGCGAEGQWFCAVCSRSLIPVRARHCPFCGQETLFGQTCEQCQTKRALAGALSFYAYGNPLLQRLIHVWKYDGVAELTPVLGMLVARGLDKTIIKLEKTRAQLLGGLDASRLRQWENLPTSLLLPTTILTPIPLHARRKRQRGFNQAELLARALSKNINPTPNQVQGKLLVGRNQKNCDPTPDQVRGRLLVGRHQWTIKNLLARTRPTAAQAKLAGADRLMNLSDAFVLTVPASDIANQHILLIDDVFTTGSTCEAAARVLKSAGAASVWAITLAYGHAGQNSDL